MNMKMQLLRGTLALVMFASLGAWAVTHRVVSAKSSAACVGAEESQLADAAMLATRKPLRMVTAERTARELATTRTSHTAAANMRIVSVTLAP